MTLDREELKRLLKEKGVKSLDDFNAFMREETHRELELEDQESSKDKGDLPPKTILSSSRCTWLLKKQRRSGPFAIRTGL